MSNLWEPVSGVYWSTVPFLPSLGWLKSLGNSSFFTTVFGALAGAFAGAWAAQRIAARNKLQDELLKEIRSVNSAILLGQAIFNIALAIKVDGALPLKTAYDEEVKIFKENANDFQGKFKGELNLEKIRCATMPISALHPLVLTEISSSAGAVRALLHLKIAIDGHLEAHVSRNDLIDGFIRKEFPRGLKFEDLYFGQERDGVTHRAYADSIRDIYKTADDILFYSQKMCEYLHLHAVGLRLKYKKVSKEKIIIGKLIIDSRVDPNLIPREESYAEWLAGYQPYQNATEAPWWHLRSK
ncbi:hypothetical protein [Pseudomonas chlororaphis]|uniref:hypothetical protein n=1 Tax=Pseudomonas chlororaphis TaxID=587753 RepID=UPI000F58F1BD|nr:hypothetical protein [Pseudomonas chlororaphis]AZD78736.1 hypothetical protein C4K15_2169 [Pseudomonas chlororaphis subsp. aurantiaca]